jgi:hypothetical protein
MDLKEVRWKYVVWIHLAQVRNKWQAAVTIVINLAVT